MADSLSTRTNVSQFVSQHGAAWATPGAYVYILNHLHRSGVYLGNQYQLPLMAIAWVTYMLIFM